MKFTISVLTAAANLAGLSAAARGMLEHCSSFTIEGLNGIQGHAIMLKASCQGIVSDLDINNCFGWDPAGGNMIMPPSGGFTKFVTQCSNSNSGDANFGNNFGCWGPWTGYSDDYYQFALNSYIGVENGHLTC